MVAGFVVEPERGAGIEGRKGADWGYGEGAEGWVPCGEGPWNAYGNC